MICYICKVGNFSMGKYVPPLSGIVRSRAEFKCDYCGHKEVIK